MRLQEDFFKAWNSIKKPEIKPIDSHAHFELMKNVKKVNVSEFQICVKEVFDSITEYRKAHVWKSWELLKPYFGFVHPSIGFHPNEAKKGNWDKVKKVEEFTIEHSKEIVAIGEIGLDYYHAKTEKEKGNQLAIFRHFLELALELNKPVVVHARDAEEDAVKEVEKFSVKVYFHAFSGKNLKEVEELGYIGISTGIEFIPEVKEIAKKVELDRILLETDSPYMSPFKGKRNNPCNVLISAKRVAEIKGLQVDEVIKQANKNAYSFFDFVKSF